MQLPGADQPFTKACPVPATHTPVCAGSRVLPTSPPQLQLDLVPLLPHSVHSTITITGAGAGFIWISLPTSLTPSRSQLNTAPFSLALPQTSLPLPHLSLVRLGKRINSAKHFGIECVHQDAQNKVTRTHRAERAHAHRVPVSCKQVPSAAVRF